MNLFESLIGTTSEYLTASLSKHFDPYSPTVRGKSVCLLIASLTFVLEAHHDTHIERRNPGFGYLGLLHPTAQ